jgi:hypothetical protein
VRLESHRRCMTRARPQPVAVPAPGEPTARDAGLPPDGAAAISGWPIIGQPTNANACLTESEPGPNDFSAARSCL